jgi:hypothetical protein
MHAMSLPYPGLTASKLASKRPQSRATDVARVSRPPSRPQMSQAPTKAPWKIPHTTQDAK